MNSSLNQWQCDPSLLCLNFIIPTLVCTWNDSPIQLLHCILHLLDSFEKLAIVIIDILSNHIPPINPGVTLHLSVSLFQKFVFNAISNFVFTIFINVFPLLVELNVEPVSNGVMLDVSLFNVSSILQSSSVVMMLVFFFDTLFVFTFPLHSQFLDTIAHACMFGILAFLSSALVSSHFLPFAVLNYRHCLCCYPLSCLLLPLLCCLDSAPSAFFS